MINLTKKGTANETKHVLVQNELNKLPEKFKILSTTGLTKSLIKNYSFQMDYKYLVFVSMKNVSFKNSKTYLWQSLGMSEESINNPHTSDSNFAP